MDVTALYSNIDHERGIQCVDKYLTADDEIPLIQRTFIIEGLSLILKKKIFSI